MDWNVEDSLRDFIDTAAILPDALEGLELFMLVVELSNGRPNPESFPVTLPSGVLFLILLSS